MANGRQKETPKNIDQLIAIVQKEYSLAAIRITGRARTLRRQAELMAERIRGDRREFLGTYVRRSHIAEIDQWFLRNPSATLEETVVKFERIVRAARRKRAVVSIHLSDTARDISWPIGSPKDWDSIENRITELGAVVIREPNAAGGRHWHIDW